MTPPVRRRRFALLWLCALAAGSSGCVYRVAVQQGNLLDPKQVAQLQTGMTRSQVRFLLGTPVLPTAFDADRWDYVYYLKVGRRGAPIQQRLTVYFEQDRVARFDSAGIDPPPPRDVTAGERPDTLSAAPQGAPGARGDAGFPSDRS